MRPIDADALMEYCNNLKDKTIDANDIARFPTACGWISVKERLPERYERILTYDKYSGVKENWLLRSFHGVSWSYGFHVTHWMPLPEPPKDGEQNDKL